MYIVQLWEADVDRLRRIWGGVNGTRVHALLHGVDLPSPATTTRTMGHQHVLSPDGEQWTAQRQ
jgi:hypothetical protein